MTHLTTEELLPCPFCKGEARAKHDTMRLATNAWITCTGCGGEIYVENGGIEAAIAAWNRRATLPTAAAPAGLTVKTWEQRNRDFYNSTFDGVAPTMKHMVDEIADLRAQLAAKGSSPATQQAEPGADEWRVGEFWSSARPGKIVLMISRDAQEIAHDGAHESFIRWVGSSRTHAAPVSPSPSERAEVRLVAAPDEYEYGPEGMPRVKRMPHAVLDCLIENSLFRYLGGALEGEDRDRLYGLMHDTANETLARLPAWPAGQQGSSQEGGEVSA